MVAEKGKFYIYPVAGELGGYWQASLGAKMRSGRSALSNSADDGT
jgi:hypothetical protein